MLAARIHGWGAPPVVEEVPDPVPADGESLLRVTAAAVAHIDLTVASGTLAFRPELPYVPGTEGAASRRFPPDTPAHIRGRRS